MRNSPGRRSMDTSSAPYSEQYYPYDPSLSWGRSDYNITRQEKIYGMWQPVILPRQPFVDREGRGRMVLQRDFEPAHRISHGARSTRFRGQPVLFGHVQTVIRSCYPAAYLGGAGHDTSNDAYKSGPGVLVNGVNKNFPNGGLAYFTPPAFTLGPAFPATGGTPPQPPGVGRNSLTGPGYRDVDATVSKSFGFGKSREWAKVPGHRTARRRFQSVQQPELQPGGHQRRRHLQQHSSDAISGRTQTALGSRTVTLQARFHF